MGNMAQAFDRIRTDLQMLSAARPTAAKRFARIRDDLLRLHTRSAQRAAFRAAADAFFDRVFAAPDYTNLAEKADRLRDPALLNASLLGCLNRSRRETLHTQALAGLLNPQRCDHGELLLRAFLNQAREGLTDGIELKWTTVRAECTLELPRKGRTERPRPDLLFELRGAEGSAPSRVVVVENKIDALDHDNQLDDYSAAASLRYPRAELYFVYLTLHGAAPAQDVDSSWQTFSYETLALMLRRQLAILDRSEAVSHGWRDVLRLYLATIVQDLLQWRIFDQQSRASRWRASRYLQAASVWENDDA
jgi:hypothetical protein